jgi:alkylhydroperoxidase/carboxymuconolactone decarboxylase family protein YurZ
VDEQQWNFPFEETLHEVFPALHEAQNAWMSQIESLHAPDRKTSELIRMVVTCVVRNGEGVQRHARFAHEVGATWDEILGALMLTSPAAGVLPAVAAIPYARRGYEEAREAESD